MLSNLGNNWVCPPRLLDAVIPFPASLWTGLAYSLASENVQEWLNSPKLPDSFRQSFSRVKFGFSNPEKIAGRKPRSKMAFDDFNWKVDIPISTMILAAWGSYTYWSTLLPDWDKISYGLKIGYTFALMALLVVTFLLLKLEKGLIALVIFFSPFLLACLLFLYVRWYLSFLFVFNAWLYRTSNVSKECCRLCQRCQSIVDRSPLLVGSLWLFSRSTERHSFYTKEELEKSAKNCHMCVLVLKSVEEFSESLEKKMTKFNSGFTLVIRDRRPFDGLSRDVNLNLELSGPSIGKARRVRVVRDKFGISGYSSKCQESLFIDWGS